MKEKVVYTFSSCINMNVLRLLLHFDLIWFEQECIDLNHRAKCLNYGNKLKCDFAIMSLASKKWLLIFDSIIIALYLIKEGFGCCECQGSG